MQKINGSKLCLVLPIRNFSLIEGVTRWNVGVLEDIEAIVWRCSVKKVQACNFIKKETLAQMFSVNFAKFLTPSFIEHLWWPFVKMK